MVEKMFAEIAILVVILVVIGLILSIYEFRENVFPKKEVKKKGNVARRLDE